LRVWLFNNELFAHTPKYYDKTTIFIDLDRFIDNLKKEVDAIYPLRKKDNEQIFMSLDDMWTKMKEAILSREIQKAVDAVKTHSINDQSVIGERELRKILNQCLSGVSL